MTDDIAGRGGGLMQITRLQIRNFKSIKDMDIRNISSALILVGRNNTGKTGILDAIRLLYGLYHLSDDDFRKDYPNIEIDVTLGISAEDLQLLHDRRMISNYRQYNRWVADFVKKFPSYKPDGKDPAAGGRVTFHYVANHEGRIRYEDGFKKNNADLIKLLPPVYYVDSERSLEKLQDDLLSMQEDGLIQRMRQDTCLFDPGKTCTHCFDCIGLINKKTPEQLNAFETAKLLDYKLFHLNLDDFSRRININYHKNGGTESIFYTMNRDIERMLMVTTEIYNPKRAVLSASKEQEKDFRPISNLGKGMRSIYMLSLLETYAESDELMPGLVLVEEPELFLHPKLQKTSGDILYRIARENQVIFSTHSPNLLPNFNSRQIRQVYRNDYDDSCIRGNTDISRILDDLGYTASDMMNVDFVFIVEGKQDKSRLPLLLRRYYSEIYQKDGTLSRVSIISTNSCTNIRTYANLKYMNQVYIKDQFLMIRDGDGKDPQSLRDQLTGYYKERLEQDGDMPRVTDKNVLILKYYSFENYFLNPEIMAKIGVIDKPEDFYRIFLIKWKEYLSRISSAKRLKTVIGRDLRTEEDVKRYMEEIKVYIRGHNLFDIFYGPFKKRENEILTRYINTAPREEFADILDVIDSFIYFENRKKAVQ